MAESDSEHEVEPAEIQREEDTALTRRVVRPPRVWMGIGVALVGMVVIGLALVSPVQWVAFIGAILVIAGGALAWWNGVLADAHGGGMTETAEEELPDDAHLGTLPGDRLHDERAVSEAARAEAAAASAEGSEREAPPVSRFEKGRAAAAFLAISAAWLVLTLPTFDLEPANRNPALRQAVLAIVIALAAIRMVVTGPTLKWAATAGAAATLLLVSLAIWWPEYSGPRVSGLIGGTVALVAAVSAIVAVIPRRTTL